MSKDPDTGTAEEEQKTSDLLALLYPEEGAEGTVDAAAYEGDDELESMMGLRSLFRDLPDEEPSDAVSNKLLALAAQHAPKPKEERRGLFAWLSDLVMPLAAHPGLAAAASLVLVAGVAGALYVSGGAKMAEPTASSRQEAPESTASLESAAESEPSAAVAGGEAPSEEAGEGAEDTGAFGDSLARPDEPLAKEQGELAEGIEANRSLSTEKRKRKEQPKARPSRSQKKSAAKPASVFGGTLGGSARGAGAKNAGPAPSLDFKQERRVKDIVSDDFRDNEQAPKQPAPEPEPSVAPPPPPGAPVTRNQSSKSEESSPADEAEDDSSDKGGSADGEPSAASLHKRALNFAAKGNCTQVAAIGRQIRSSDSAYYDRKFVGDSRLKKCLDAARAVKKRK